MGTDTLSIGREIKEARIRAHMTQKELAKLLKVSPQMISMYENGVRIPKYKTVDKIAKALKMPTDLLIRFSEISSDTVSPEGESLVNALDFVNGLKDEDLMNCIKSSFQKIREVANDGGFYFSDNFYFHKGAEFDNVLYKFDFIEDLAMLLNYKLENSGADDWSEEELQQINDFKNYIRSKRSKGE